MAKQPTQPAVLTAETVEKIANSAVVHTRRPGRWVASIAVLVLAVVCVDIIASNPNFGWRRVGDYLFDPTILRGLWLTIWLTAVAMVIGIVLGVLLAIARMLSNPIVSGAARLFIWFFRGTPVLVQLIFWYNLAALFPHIALGIPFGGPTFTSIDANSIITPLTAALLGLGLNEGAYMAEIVRAGISAVDSGQVEAGKSLGMRFSQLMRVIVLPQAMRVIIPPTGNETIGMLKTTSLVSVIALADLLYAAQSIYSVNFQTIPLLITICLWYLLLTSILSLGQGRLERRYRQGDATIRRVRRLGLYR